MLNAVAPPHPGAWTQIGGHTFIIGKARLSTTKRVAVTPGLAVIDNGIVGVCGDGGILRILELLQNGIPVTASALQQILQSHGRQSCP